MSDRIKQNKKEIHSKKKLLKHNTGKKKENSCAFFFIENSMMNDRAREMQDQRQ